MTHAQRIAAMHRILDKAESENRDLTEAEQREFNKHERSVRLANAEHVDRVLGEPQPTLAAHRMGRPPRGPEAKKEFENIGEFLHAATFHSETDQRLDYHEFEIKAANDLEVATGARGGFAVPQQFHDSLFSVDPAVANIRPRATVLPAGSPPDAAISVPALDQSGTTGPQNMFGGISLNWGAEAATMTQTDTSLREITLEPREISGFLKVSNKLLRNWMSGYVAIERLLRGAVMSAEERAFVQGSGAGQPLGIVNSDAAYLVNRAVSNEFRLADLDAMVARLLMRGGDPVWIISQSVMPQIRAMRNYSEDSPALGDGALVWQPDKRDGDGRPLLNGYPILWSERSPTLGSKGDVILADLTNYLIKDGSGVFVDASPHVYFTTNQTAVRIIWNVDGSPWLSSTINLEDDYDVGGFVVLDVPS